MFPLLSCCCQHQETVYSRSGVRCLCHRMSRAQLNYAATPESVEEGYTDSGTGTFLNYPRTRSPSPKICGIIWRTCVSPKPAIWFYYTSRKRLPSGLSLLTVWYWCQCQVQHFPWLQLMVSDLSIISASRYIYYYRLDREETPINKWTSDQLNVSTVQACDWRVVVSAHCATVVTRDTRDTRDRSVTRQVSCHGVFVVDLLGTNC